MTKFLDELPEKDEEIYVEIPSWVVKAYEYKKTCVDIISMIKLFCQNLENYIVPESAIVDRRRIEPKGR